MNTKTKDFFLHLGAMVALYAGVIALLNLLFKIINVAFPKIDEYRYGFFGSSSISLQVAILLVVFPLFLFLMNLIRRGYQENPERKEYAVRKWLIWITLFVAGIAITADLVTLLYYFLDGRELTAGFSLKVLSVLVVSGGVFGYFIDDLKDRLNGSRRNFWRILSAILVIGSIVLGFMVTGSPRTQRLANYDQLKINDLQNIQSQVIQYWQMKGEIPENLDVLRDPLSSYNFIPLDPQTGQSYEYQKTGEMSFSICAEFNLDSVSSRANPRISNVMKYGLENENWNHAEGVNCFERTVDPERYPIFNKN